MSSGSLIWGILALASGIFICAHGNVLFRFVLAALKEAGVLSCQEFQAEKARILAS